MPDNDTNANVNVTETAATQKASWSERSRAFFRKINLRKVAPIAMFASFTVLLLVALILIGMQAAQEVNSVKATANQALSLAATTSDRVDTAEQGIALLAGENQAQNQRLTAVEQATVVASETATAAVAKADTANSRLNAKKKADNQLHKQHVAYIRGANPDSPIAKKSNAEIEALLNDGIWNIEGDIQTEFDRLIALAAAQAKQTADSVVETAKLTATKLEAVDVTATKALAAGDTAVSGIKVIADQPNKLFGKSVNGDSKKTLQELVATYSK